MLIACVRSRKSFHCPLPIPIPDPQSSPGPSFMWFLWHVSEINQFRAERRVGRTVLWKEHKVWSWVQISASLIISGCTSVMWEFSCVWLFVTPMDYIVHGILQARILEWVAITSSRWSSQPRDWTQVSCIVGEFFTSWATREAQEYWSGQLIPSPADLPDPEIELGSPALQADSLPTELSGKPSVGIMLIPTSWDC